MNKKAVLFAVVSVLWMVGTCYCAEATILEDNFDSYNESLWGSKASAIAVEDGKLINRPPQGGANLISLKKYKYVSLEMRVQFDTLSSDSSIFYYLGFQSVIPWAENVCCFTVQDGSMTAGVGKSEQKGVRQTVTDIKVGTWYVLKIEWKPESVEFFIDGKSVLKTQEAQAIPDVAIPIFLGANTLRQTTDKDAASLRIDSVKLAGEPQEEKVKPVGGTSGRSQKQFEKSIGDPDSAFIRVGSQVIHLENQNFINELAFDGGLRWSRLFNKATEDEYLSDKDTSPVFKLLGKRFSLASTDFDITDIKVSEEGQKKILTVLLANTEEKIECELLAQIDNSQEILWSLAVKNTAKQKVKIKPIFPIISTIDIAGNAAGNNYFFPWRSGIVGKVNCDLLYEYGGLAWMQIVSIFNPDTETGFYVYPKDSSGTMKGMIFKKFSSEVEGMVTHSELTASYEVPKEDAFELNEGIGLAYYYFEQEVGAGEQVVLPPTAIGIYRGGWKEALQNYSTWAHSWYKHVDTPSWFMNSFNFLPQHKPAYYSTEAKKYVASERLAGSEHLVQWAHWWDYQEKQDWTPDILMGREQPGDFDYNKDRGGLAAFKEEIKRLQDKGTRFTVYIDHRFCCKETKIGQAKGEQWAAVYKPGGSPEGYGGPADQYVTCYMEPNAWPHYLAQTCGRIIKDTGMDGIYLDELALPFACYNPDHIHNKKYKSIVYLPAFVASMVESREAMRRENPEAILMTEHAGSDYFSQFIDGSWSQTFYATGFPFAEKYFDDYSINYFHFCFPEFKLAEWGDAHDGPRRCFFNGIGIDWGAGSQDYLRKTGQILKENGDAFASRNPEPIVETKVNKVFANKFRVIDKTVYTVYNKSGKDVDREILEVDQRSNYHWVEMLYDNPVKVRQELVKTKDVLSLKMDVNEVVCVGHLPVVINAVNKDKQVVIQLVKDIPGAVLYAYLGEDTSQLNNKGAVKIDIQNGQGNLTCEQKGKVILKLMKNDILIDEAILNVEN